MRIVKDYCDRCCKPIEPIMIGEHYGVNIFKDEEKPSNINVRRYLTFTQLDNDKKVTTILCKNCFNKFITFWNSLSAETNNSNE